ncbi:hypothetical protein BJ138DRAFT_1233543 [Hygrophoropsis aurantiaca]|uniref:Uncharacterized protein n=1 Tax=Hygrophoropsis aurantiaca TaxID=72124 RepID=A0ACB7ZVC1_9AGAM|nr:hypothetical protein BJ138DRAFT_1233543 [Hygrophoropsis aurantiaca]
MPCCPRCLKYFPTAKRWTSGPIHVHKEHTPVPSRSPSPPFDSFEINPDDLAFVDGDFQPDVVEDDQNLPDHHSPDLQSHSPSNVDKLGQTVVLFDGAAAILEAGQTFLMRFDMDDQFIRRRSNLYYPFANLNDWKLANFLLMSSLSMRDIDNFLSLNMVKMMPISFRTAKELRARAESLPSGPRWNFRIVATTHPTTQPVHLYFRDSLDCIESLFNHPLFRDHMDFSPFRLYTTAERLIRVYTEWMSSDGAWEMQTKIPEGATLCGVVLSSDKTHITNMCGGRVAHPLLISLANIKMSVRNKGSSHAFLLLALMPIAKFTHANSRMNSVLDARLFHQCLDIVLKPLKQAAELGRMMSDPVGNQRYCFTLLASYIVDTPEACMLSCVRGLTSPLTMAMYQNFGDPEPHPPRTAAITLAQLGSIDCDPDDVAAYFAACEPDRLSGVSHPFWRDWPLADPSSFLTPEPLHHWHREFWDHDIQWCKIALGADELDFRFSVLPPITTLRHFGTGITKLKQVGGRAQRDAQRYIVVVIAGKAAPSVVTAVRALVDFRYLAQAPAISTTTRDKIQSALREFHENKEAILNSGLRRGAKTKAALDHWHIPKLEMMQSVVPSIERVGSLLQWSADTTEHAHIEVVKDPAATTNNHNYDTQICRYLDRSEKCRLFDTATTLRASENPAISNTSDPDSDVDHGNLGNAGDSDNGDDDDGGNILDDIWTSNRQTTDFFRVAAQNAAASPPRTFVASPSTAIHLNSKYSVRASVDDIAQMFDLPDLRAALADYLSREGAFTRNFHSFGGRRHSAPNAALPFEALQVWYKFRLQQRMFHDPNETAPTFTVHAQSPNLTWKFGRYDSAILQVDQAHDWPSSGLTGHVVVQVRLIMCPVPLGGMNLCWSNRTLIYVQRFDIVHQGNDLVEKSTGLHVLKRSTRASGDPLGDIFPLDQVRSYAHVVPRFGPAADSRLSATNSIYASQSFYLNRYFDKDFFYVLSQ